MGEKFESYNNPDAAHEEAKAMEGVIKEHAEEGAEIGYEAASKIRDLETLTGSFASDLEKSLGTEKRSGASRFRIESTLATPGAAEVRYSVRSIHEMPADEGEPVDFDYSDGDYGSGEIVMKFGEDGKPTYELTGDIDEKDRLAIEESLRKLVSKE